MARVRDAGAGVLDTAIQAPYLGLALEMNYIVISCQTPTILESLEDLVKCRHGHESYCEELRYKFRADATVLSSGIHHCQLRPWQK